MKKRKLTRKERRSYSALIDKKLTQLETRLRNSTNEFQYYNIFAEMWNLIDLERQKLMTTIIRETDGIGNFEGKELSTMESSLVELTDLATQVEDKMEMLHSEALKIQEVMLREGKLDKAVIFEKP